MGKWLCKGTFGLKTGLWEKMGIQRDFGLKLVFWGKWPYKGTFGLIWGFRGNECVLWENGCAKELLG